jgi:hypothetical protein
MFWPSMTQRPELDDISCMARRHMVATMARLERAVGAVSQDPSTCHVDPPQPVVVATRSKSSPSTCFYPDSDPRSSSAQ